MDYLLKIVMGSMWVQPFALLFYFGYLEERARKARFSDKIRNISQLKVKHDKADSEGNECVTPLSNIVKDQQSNEILKLYYVDYPTIQECLYSLHVKNLALYVALAAVLLLLQYLLSQVPANILSTEQADMIKTGFSSLGLLFLFSYAAYLWWKRYLRIRIFCDQIQELKGE